MPQLPTLEATAPTGGSPTRDTPAPTPAPTRRISASLVGYAMGPAALLLILVLRGYGLVADEPAWLWVAVFVVVPATSVLADLAYRQRPSTARLQTRVALHCAAVTLVIYLSGWGPVLIGAYAFVALENLAHDGSRTWRMTLAWSLVGISVGQIAIWQGWMPSFLSTKNALALSVMGAFVLGFVIRMAGAAWQQKEDAESATRASEDRFRSLVQHSTDTTLVIDDHRRIAYASPAATALLGFEPDAVIGRDAVEFMHPDDVERVLLQLGSLVRAHVVADGIELRLRHVDGSWRTVEAVLTDLRNRPSVGGFVANLRDITERKEAEDLLAHRAVHDPLTGLANRTLILDRAEQMLVRCRRTQEPVAALFIDLDNFKEVNDTLGHEAGDQLLRAIAARFAATVRASDTVGRLGGDEFVVLAEGMSFGRGTGAARRALPRRPARAVPARRPQRHAVHHREHRHRRGRPGRRRGPAARRRHRAVPRQGDGQGLRHAVRARDAVGGDRPARAEDGPADRARQG